MLGIELEFVDSLSGCVQRVWILAGDTVVLKHSHVVVVSDRGPHTSVPRRSSEEPDVKVLAVTQASGNTASLDCLPPMPQVSLDVHPIGQWDRYRLLVGQKGRIRSAIDLYVLIGACGIACQ